MGRPTKKIPEDAFEFYFSLGAERSYEAVAEKYEVGLTTVKEHAGREGWQERLRRLETKAREAADGRILETLEVMNKRHLQVYRAIQGRALEALRGMAISSAYEAVRALDLAVKGERNVLGEPAEQKEEDITEKIRQEYERWLIVGRKEDGNADN